MASSTSSSASSSQSSSFDHNNSSSMTIDGFLRNAFASAPPTDATLLNAEITVADAPSTDINTLRMVDDVWRDIVDGNDPNGKEMKEEALEETMTLEDFLAKTEIVEGDMKVPVTGAERISGGLYTVDSIVSGRVAEQVDRVERSGFGGDVIGGRGRGKRGNRGRVVEFEPLDKAAEQRQRRMIKNRESAARSREKKQAYTNELEERLKHLEEENAQLLKEKAETTKERLKQLMENIIPVVEKRKLARPLRRVSSWRQ